MDPLKSCTWVKIKIIKSPTVKLLKLGTVVIKGLVLTLRIMCYQLYIPFWFMVYIWQYIQVVCHMLFRSIVQCRDRRRKDFILVSMLSLY